MTWATARFRSTCLLIVVLPPVLVPGSAFPEDDQQHVVEYRAFRNALETGDEKTAASHALAAWRAAEVELGDHRTTAILAYNYAHRVLFNDSESALPPLRRARELQEAGTADLPADELLLHFEFAEFSSGGFKARQANKLRKSLEAADAAGMETTPYVTGMWLSLAQADISNRQFKKARKSAMRAEASARSVSPGGVRDLAGAILLQGIARLVPYPRTVEDVQAAHNEFHRARRLFSPQENLDAFDPLLAKLLAWDGAAGAALRSLGREDYPDHASEADEATAPPKLFRYQEDDSINCSEVEWLERPAPQFPSSALRRGSIGAVYVGYRLGDDLTVHEARILSEVPVAEFGDSALKTMTRWRAKELPSGGPECRRNLVTRFAFAIRS
jgi:hypothetical protein